MAISDKLLYLNGTKQAIKDELNRFGSNITENDTFRSYSNVLNDIYDKLPKVSANGTDFSLENAQNGKLDSFGMDGNTEQTTYSGINILSQNNYISSQTVNGITYTNNGDGTFNISGTATENTSLRIIDVGVFNLERGQAYYLYSSVPYNIDTFNMSIVTIEDGVNKYFRANTTYTPSTTPTNSRLQFYIASGNTVNVQNVKLMLVKDSTAPTEYEPYVGGTPSPNPDYPQDVKVVENEQIVNVSGKNLCSSVVLQNAQNVRFYFDKKIGKTLTISFTTNESLNTNSLYLSATNTLATTITADANTKATATFTLSDEQYSAIQSATNPYFLLFKSGANFTAPTDGQIENGSSVTSYEPYQSQDFEIDLGDIELCKIDTYKDSIKKSIGKNLFDKNSQNLKQGYILNDNGEETTSNISQYSQGFTSVNPNTTYTLSGTLASSTNGFRLYLYDENKNFLSRSDLIGINFLPYTFTTNNSTYYLRFQTGIEAYNGDTVQLEKNNQATDYEPYGEQWYIKKEIGKVVLDGSENWTIFDTGTANTSLYGSNVIDNISIIPFIGLSNYFVNSLTSLWAVDYEGLQMSSSNTDKIRPRINKTIAPDVATLKNWLSTHNTTVYYILATPTYEKITNSTLISQLESIEAFTGLNNFSVSNDNNVLPTLYVSRLKELGKLE